MKLSVRTFTVLLVFAFILTACGTAGTGIKGQAFLARCTGTEIATGCAAQDPYPATLVILDQNMNKVKTVKTAGDGTFVIPLDPGTYFVHPEHTAQFPVAADFKVVVKQGVMQALTIYYDTGIR